MALQEITLDRETNHSCARFSFSCYPKFSISLLNVQLEWNHSQICLTEGFETFQKKYSEPDLGDQGIENGIEADS